MPGKLRYQHHKLHTISKVFVSSPSSAENGLLNWGIPKELADFRLINEGNGLETIKVTQNGVPILDITIKTSQANLAFPWRTFFIRFLWYSIGMVKRSGSTFGQKPRETCPDIKSRSKPGTFPQFCIL